MYGRNRPAFDQFRDGLSTLGVLKAIQQYPGSFKAAFCEAALPLTAAMFENKETVLYTRSEIGSNKYNLESNILAYFADFLQAAEEEELNITLSQILMFSTGLKEIQFLHDKELGKDGAEGELSRFPKPNTCSCILHLPVVHRSYENFIQDMVFGIVNAKHFGYA
uniref:Uncharacterized protein LOC102804688 n=1 Tax=Saccoglossus kowalevskii TaxID=10224 RepID=A0ABM0LZM4_SACKO|nr:PREDICTED: uncharacterized protein LOC102804688 [Saccoglossus kowalevskii]